MLYELLLHRAKMRAHKLFSLGWITVANHRCNSLVRGRIARLIIDAMRGFATMPPASIRRHMEHRIENRHQ
jgi:hypothetical protein